MSNQKRITALMLTALGAWTGLAGVAGAATSTTDGPTVAVGPQLDPQLNPQPLPPGRSAPAAPHQDTFPGYLLAW